MYPVLNRIIALTETGTFSQVGKGSASKLSLGSYAEDASSAALGNHGFPLALLLCAYLCQHFSKAQAWKKPFRDQHFSAMRLVCF
jgi:hypothetical protein